MLGSIGEAADDDARQPIFALEPYEIVLESHDLENEAPRTMGLDLPPMLATRIVRRGFDDAVVLGAGGIGQDDQAAVVVVDRIIVLGFARRDETRRCRWIFCIDQAHLGGLVIVNAEQEEAPILGRAESEEVAGVVLLLDRSSAVSAPTV